MEASNVRAVRYTAGGACGVGRARIVGVVATASGAGRLTITEASGGATKLDLDLATGATHVIDIPGDGLLCAEDPFISALTNISGVTILFV
jgi:hypothetical protein